jgi:hypothetical protein
MCTLLHNHPDFIEETMYFFMNLVSTVNRLLNFSIIKEPVTSSLSNEKSAFSLLNSESCFNPTYKLSQFAVGSGFLYPE